MPEKSANGSKVVATHKGRSQALPHFSTVGSGLWLLYAGLITAPWLRPGVKIASDIR